MSNIDSATVAKRSIQGVLSLIFRSSFIQIVNTVSLFVLAAYLNQSAFGVFYIVSAVLSFLVYFSDIGLAAALVQKRDDVTDEDLKTTFTIQQILVLTLVVGALVLSSFFSDFYDLDQPGLWLFQALVISFFFSSLKTIPSILLERKLDFQKLIVPQIAETIVYNTSAIYFAIHGFGVTSFTIAILARGAVGVITMYLVAPWKPSFGISKQSAKKLLSYGFPFQTNSILALLKDDLLVIFLGKILTRGEMGYIGFSQKVAYLPLRFAMDNIVRITFPAFSRLQEDTKALQRGLEKSIFVITGFVTPFLIGLVILTPYVTTFIPRYEQWKPALFSLVFFAANALLSSISTPLTNFLNAVGKIKITLMLMVFWTAATWGTTVIGIQIFGFHGVSVASFIVSLSVVWVIFIVKKYIDININKAIRGPLISGIIMGGLLYFVAPYVVINMLALIVVSIFFGLLYFYTLYLIERNEVKADIIWMKRIFKKAS